MHEKVQQLGEVRRSSGQRSVAEVLSDVLFNLQDILRSEIRLAHFQARAELRTLRSAAFAIVAALSLIISVWGAALLVAIVMAVVCAVLVRSGAKRMRSEAEKAASVEERTPWAGPPTE
jgi:hypothetical protein